MTNHLIIWSKDRACQLHLLLESLKRFSVGFDKVSVIFKASNEHIHSYAEVFTHFNWVAPILERDFREDTLSLLRDKRADNIGFCTDDTVVFRDFYVGNLSLKENEVFSLRLGLNTILQNCYTGQYQTPLNRYCENGETISWNPLDYHPQSNYGYPAALDLHIFNREKVCGLAESIDFKNTNSLEGALSTIARQHFSSITSFKRSVAINIPCNNMSGYTRSGESHHYSCEELLSKYMDGYIIDLDDIHAKANTFVGCHQEIEFKWRKNG